MGSGLWLSFRRESEGGTGLFWSVFEYPISNKEYPMMKERQYDLQERFVDYSVRVIRLCDALPETRAGRHVCSQVLRSGTSPAPNYGEAQSAESTADFVHKLKIALKELRETDIWLKVIARAPLVEPAEKIRPLVDETNELISILVASVGTAKRREGE
jgi:four helix bundle protein